MPVVLQRSRSDEPEHGPWAGPFLSRRTGFCFLLTPLFSLLSRRDEFQADRYAAAHASASDLVAALVKMYEDNAATLTPDPLHSLFYDSHPPAALRIARLQDA
jgi:STE24 endopeptidase